MCHFCSIYNLNKEILFLAVLLAILKHNLWLNWSRSHYHDYTTDLLYKCTFYNFVANSK